MNHHVADTLRKQLTLPVIGAPMFLVSGPELLIAQCASGVIGSLPALNARPQKTLSAWLGHIENELKTLRQREPERQVAPYAINLIIHRSNERVEADLETCAKHKVPIIITSLSAPHRVVQTVHNWGGVVFHDVTTLRHAQKALEAGVDGLILVCAGAGGHAGTLSPFALVGEVRKIFDGPLILSGAISRGQDIAAARAMGADFAYMGTRFIASHEAKASTAYQQAIIDARTSDILYTPYFTGIPGNYLKTSIRAAGLDPEQLPTPDLPAASFGSEQSRPWKDIWGAGQGAGTIHEVLSVTDIVQQLKHEYTTALASL